MLPLRHGTLALTSHPRAWMSRMIEYCSTTAIGPSRWESGRILKAEYTDADTAPETVLRDDGGHIDLGHASSALNNDRRVLVTHPFNRSADGPRAIEGTILEAN